MQTAAETDDLVVGAGRVDVVDQCLHIDCISRVTVDG